MNRRQRRRHLNALDKADDQGIEDARRHATGWRSWLLFRHRAEYDDAIVGHRRIFYVEFFRFVKLRVSTTRPRRANALALGSV